MRELICPLCNEVIKTGQVRKEWWMSDFDKRIAHAGCTTSYEKGVVKGMRMTVEEYNNLMARRDKGDLAAPSTKGRSTSKYHSQKVVIDGITFDSKKEGQRYSQLKMLEKAGLISDLRLQVPFELAPPVMIKGRRKPPLRYFADFRYIEDGQTVIEDCKSDITRKDSTYRVKIHLMKSVHGLDVTET